NKRVKADLILISSTNTKQEIVAYQFFQFLEFEVSEKLQGQLACGSQSYIATLLL
ncbi:hypothetical protein FRACYDRAFT_164603, partial [Fragilariopsis cylindrus CCMP1102]